MKNAFFYFIIFPFLGFFQALKNYRSSWAKPSVIAFVAFFGLTMVKSETVDSSRYIHKLEGMYASNKSFDDIKASLYSDEGGQADIYVAIVTYFVYGLPIVETFFPDLWINIRLFYANNIWLVLDQSKGKLSKEQYLLLAAFALIIGF